MSSGGFEPDDDVDVAGFVFEGDEGYAGGGAGALAAGDQTGDLDGDSGAGGF